MYQAAGSPVRDFVICCFDVVEKTTVDNTTATPHQGYFAVIEWLIKIHESLSRQHKALSIGNDPGCV